MLRLLALCSVLSLACGAADTDAIEPVGAPQTVVEAPEVVETVEAAAPACQFVFSPEESLRAETLDAAARWSKATGCDVVVGEGGIPVRLVDDLGLSPRGTRVHGWTHCPDTSTACTQSRLVIDLTPEHKPAAMAHEMGHALPAIMTHVQDEHALMDNSGGDGLILAADLVQICSALPCQAFVPEM
jgi:hypothetical protein